MLLDISGVRYSLPMQISSYLALQDLLQLSRSFKDIRQAFMSRLSTAMWKAARKTVNCPPPIAGFLEPAWANLLFMNVCHICLHILF
ncbi:uncharacterized protein EV420DRAFT_1278643 [Desarmillaria tabescens]|uniref:F-box domain-containing protein n=1 Tax=Armillaria tabescens TaxID=1929756 RepID=A0AA39JEY3_ARMTA|nr:uncharacterized protein EV420DRAFT_1278643 [Desarmillaria tabescens]KAK0441502.1 hypothetical protein EV420DRAFT_1278643 [Desarmillaria tabescens]